MKRFMGLLCIALACTATSALAADKDTRAGNCDDAKKQVEYFCRENPSDTMVALGTACTNAKNNQKAACEGVIEADKKYEFDDKSKK
jgi:hypothetical protein